MSEEQMTAGGPNITFIQPLTFLLFVLAVALILVPDTAFNLTGIRYLKISPFEALSYVIAWPIALGLLFSRRREVYRSLVFGTPHRWLALCFIWSSLALLWNLEEPVFHSLNEFKNLVPAILGYLAIVFVLHDAPWSFRWLLGAWLVAGTLHAAFGLFQFSFGGPYFTSILNKGNYFFRGFGHPITGNQFHANLFAQALIPCFAISLTTWLGGAGFKERITWRMLGVCGITGLAMFLASGRGAMLAAGLGTGLAIAMAQAPRLRHSAVFVTLWMITVIGVYFSAYITMSLSYEDAIGGTLYDRIELLRVVSILWLENPTLAIFGGGDRLWSDYVKISDFFNGSVHNVYGNQVLASGFLGLILWLTFVGTHLRAALSRAREASIRLAPDPFIAVVFGLTLNAAFEPRIFHFDLFLALALMSHASRVAKDGLNTPVVNAMPKESSLFPSKSLGVIVPTYRRPDNLARCLEALGRQTRRADEILIIVRTTDLETHAFLDALPVPNRSFRVINVEREGEVAAVNAGIVQIRSDITVVVEDDIVINDNLLEGLEGHLLRNPRAAGVCGRHLDGGIEPRVSDKRAEVGAVYWYGVWIGNHSLGYGPARPVDFLSGCAAYRTVPLKKIGYDERLRGRGSQVHQEASIGFALVRAGWQLIYDPNLSADHYPGPRFDEDQRTFHPVAHENAVFNETLILLEHLPWPNRIVFIVLMTVVGTRTVPGFLQWLRLLPSRGRLANARYRASLAGRLSGFQCWLVVAGMPQPVGK